MYCRYRAIMIALAAAGLSLALSACADQSIDQSFQYYSDLPGNGHSRAYTYPTDLTRGYTAYPVFSELGPIYRPE
jgi:hypothetical protein